MSDTGMESAVFPIHLSLWVKHLSRRGHRRQDRHCFHDNGNFPFLSDLCGALVWDKDFKWQCAGPAENIPVGNTRSVPNALFYCSLQSIVTLLCGSLCLLIVHLRIFEEPLLGLHPISNVKPFTVCCFFCQRWFWLWELQEESVSFFILPNRSRSAG